MSRFDYMKSHPEEAHIYHARMGGASGNRQEAIAAAYDFSGADTIVDVGGGNGALPRAILARNPKSRGIVFDRAEVVTAIPLDARVDGRLTVEPGDFFDRVPSGADYYLLSWILHDWSSEASQKILRNCRAAMPPTSRLLIADRLLNSDPLQGDPMDYLSDIQMMTIGGQERTAPEFQKLLTTCGFGTIQVFPTTSQVSIIETIPV